MILLNRGMIVNFDVAIDTGRTSVATYVSCAEQKALTRTFGGKFTLICES